MYSKTDLSLNAANLDKMCTRYSLTGKNLLARTHLMAESIAVLRSSDMIDCGCAGNEDGWSPQKIPSDAILFILLFLASSYYRTQVKRRRSYDSLPIRSYNQCCHSIVRKWITPRNGVLHKQHGLRTIAWTTLLTLAPRSLYQLSPRNDRSTISTCNYCSHRPSFEVGIDERRESAEGNLCV